MKNGGILISMCSGIGCLRWLIYNKMWKGLFFLLIICYNLRTANFILQAQTFLDFDVHTIAQSGGYLLALVGLLLAAALYDIDKGAVAAELDGTLRNGITWLAFANTISALAL